MSSKQERYRIAVLDDYQDVALSLADWSVLDTRATITVFNDHLADSDAVVERLQPFDIVCVMRERTAMTRTIIERLPKLRDPECLDRSEGRRRPGRSGRSYGLHLGADDRTDLGTYPGQCPPSRRREHVTAWRRMAAVGR
jgi:hypothetical protein